MSNLGSSDTPIEAANLSLPAGASIDEDNGDFVIRDSSGTIVFRRNEAANEWQFENADITGVKSLSTEQATIDGVRTAQSSVEFYVDQSNGSDSNDGTSASSAFETYERALQEAPRFPGEEVKIRQIGDYTPESGFVEVRNKKGTIQKDGVFSLTIIGDSDNGASNGNDPSTMETFDGRFHLEGLNGFKLQSLNVTGIVWTLSCPALTVYDCYIEGFWTFVYQRSGQLNLVANVFDGQANDPTYGIYALRNGQVLVNQGNEFRNWDQQNKTAYFAFAGAVIVDGLQGKYPNAGRTGITIPSGGRGIADEGFDRDLEGKDLTNAGLIDAEELDSKVEDGNRVKAGHSDFGSLQAAINFAESNGYDIVEVPPGTYNEDVTISEDGLFLLGTDNRSVDIVGDSGPAVTIDANACVVKSIRAGDDVSTSIALNGNDCIVEYIFLRAETRVYGSNNMLSYLLPSNGNLTFENGSSGNVVDTSVRDLIVTDKGTGNVVGDIA